MATKAKVEFQQYFELFKEVWKKPRLTNLETKLTWTHKGDFTIQSIRGGGKGNRDNIQQLLSLHLVRIYHFTNTMIIDEEDITYLKNSYTYWILVHCLIGWTLRFYFVRCFHLLSLKFYPPRKTLPWLVFLHHKVNLQRLFHLLLRCQWLLHLLLNKLLMLHHLTYC